MSRSHSLDALFRPKSIAVIGASRDRRTLGAEIFHNLVRCGFAGKVFPVNPKTDAVQSVKCWASVKDVPDPIDLAVLVVPAKHVLTIVDECVQKGVKGIVVISAGFKEIGASGQTDGPEREKALVEKVRAAGMRMVGPNCMGIINMEEGISMDATFARAEPVAGHVSFMTQSGALGSALLEDARTLGVGLRMFASVGNKADVSGNDLLEYWEDDPNTSVALLYLESFGNPRRFTEIARRFGKKKPIVVVKAGRSAAGAKAAGSHTGSLAGLDVAVDALFAQTGVVRVSTVEQLFQHALAFTHQPLPRGDRIAIVSNAGGPAILAADAVSAVGMRMAKFSAHTLATLRSILPREAAVENPVDMVSSASNEAYRKVVDAVLADEGVDAVIAINIPLLATSLKDVIGAIAAGRAGHDKPVFGCMFGTEAELDLQEHARATTDLRRSVTLFSYPESAVRALRAMHRYARFREKPEGKFPSFTVDRERAAALIEGARLRSRGATGDVWLLDREVFEVLHAYGIPCAPWKLAVTRDEACAAAEEIGFPVVLKISAAEVVHKTETGGVRLDLRTIEEVAAAYDELAAILPQPRYGHPVPAVLVQKLEKGGRETILGMQHDPAFGPLFMFGLGGVFVEVMKDVAFRLMPLTDVDAEEMVRSIRGFPILKGVRGAAPADLGALEEAILRLSQLVADFPSISSIDLNPFLAYEVGRTSLAVDARLSLHRE